MMDSTTRHATIHHVAVVETVLPSQHEWIKAIWWQVGNANIMYNIQYFAFHKYVS
jgi:hypothetical protein